MKKIDKHSFVLYSFLFLAGIISRLPFLEKAQSHWDGPDYTIGILHYSFIEQTPSPPGYPLYISFGKFFHMFFSDPHLSILMVSVLFAGVGAVVFYLAGKLFFNKSVGLISSCIFLSAPTIFYFGITANPYGILSITALLVALVVFLIIKKKKDYGFLLALVFSFAIGIRPQDSLFLTPLYLLGCYYLKSYERFISVVSLIFLTLFWFLPTAHAVGGVSQYFSYVISFAKNDSAPNLSIHRVTEIMPIIIKGLYLTCGFAAFFLLAVLKYTNNLLSLKKLFTKISKPYILVFIFWIFPSLLFNIFVRSDHAAHQMAYLSAFIVLSSYFLYKLFGSKSFLVVLLLIVVNLATFFRVRDTNLVGPYVSQSFHYSEIVKNNLRMKNLELYVLKNFNTTDTILITDPEIFRATSYYLKNYGVYSFGALDTNDSKHTSIVHYSKYWHYAKLSNKTHIFSLPTGINNIVVYNNNRPITIKMKNVEKRELVGNQMVYLIKVGKSEKLILSKGLISPYD